MYWYKKTYCLLNFKDVVGNLQFTKRDQTIPGKAFLMRGKGEVGTRLD